jgi:hypothetical protein
MPRSYLSSPAARSAADALMADPSVGPIVLLAVCDPGAHLPRRKLGDGEWESVPHWSSRAVLAAMTARGLLATSVGESGE